MTDKEYDKAIDASVDYLELLDDAWNGDKAAQKKLEEQGTYWRMMRPRIPGTREGNPSEFEEAVIQGEEGGEHPGGVQAVEDQGGVFN